MQELEMGANSPRRERGRPSVNPETRKRNNVTLAIRDSLKKALEERAAKKRHSINQEMTDIIELVIAYPNIFENARDTDVLSNIAQTFLRTRLPSVPGPHWLDNRAKFDFVKTELTSLFDRLQPPAVEPIDYLRLHFEGMLDLVRCAVADGDPDRAMTRAMDIEEYPPTDLKEEFLQRAAEVSGHTVAEIRAEVAEARRRAADRQ